MSNPVKGRADKAPAVKAKTVRIVVPAKVDKQAVTTTVNRHNRREEWAKAKSLGFTGSFAQWKESREEHLSQLPIEPAKATVVDTRTPGKVRKDNRKKAVILAGDVEVRRTAIIDSIAKIKADMAHIKLRYKRDWVPNNRPIQTSRAWKAEINRGNLSPSRVAEIERMIRDQEDEVMLRALHRALVKEQNKFKTLPRIQVRAQRILETNAPLENKRKVKHVVNPVYTIKPEEYQSLSLEDKKWLIVDRMVLQGIPGPEAFKIVQDVPLKLDEAVRFLRRAIYEYFHPLAVFKDVAHKYRNKDVSDVELSGADSEARPQEQSAQECASIRDDSPAPENGITTYDCGCVRNARGFIPCSMYTAAVTQQQSLGGLNEQSSTSAPVVTTRAIQFIGPSNQQSMSVTIEPVSTMKQESSQAVQKDKKPLYSLAKRPVHPDVRTQGFSGRNLRAEIRKEIYAPSELLGYLRMKISGKARTPDNYSWLHQLGHQYIENHDTQGVSNIVLAVDLDSATAAAFVPSDSEMFSRQFIKSGTAVKQMDKVTRMARGDLGRRGILRKRVYLPKKG